MIGFDIRWYESIGSTNNEALRLARAGAAHGTVVYARKQTAGRGRLGRQWHSPAGNLYVSILLRPDVAPAKAATLSFVTALAVADMIDAFLPGEMRARLKWPNDVLVDGAKIAGILTEYVDTAVIVGIGVNIRHVPSGAPYPVTSLAACRGVVPEAGAELTVLLEFFGSRFFEWEAHGFAATRTAWLARAPAPGSPLRVTLGARSVVGRFADLGPDGALMIATDDGPARIVSGEVIDSPKPV